LARAAGRAAALRATTLPPGAADRRLLRRHAPCFLVPCPGRLPDLALAVYHPLQGGEAAQPHRPVGVELRRADADLGPEPELAAVVEAARRVDHDAARVDLAKPA